MAFTFADLQTEVLRRATKDQGGTQFTAGIKNVINTSMFRVAREARWRPLRRSITFNTTTSYSTGSGAVAATNGLTTVTVTGATFITNAITVGRLIQISGSTKVFTITSITGETTLVLDQTYDGTTTTVGTYSILPRASYTLPIQIDHRAFFWHRQYGRPFLMNYVPSQEFYESGALDTQVNIPTNYMMWGNDWAIDQLKAASVITISSSSSSDTNIAVTVFGTVAGYPDYEIITTNASNGTTATAGSKSFTFVERVVKNQNTVGRITCTANTVNTTVSVLPVGNTTTGPQYSKIQLFPLPNAVFPINCFYYKVPYQLINDGDVPELGEDFTEAIILLAVCKLKAEQNQKEDADFFKLYDNEIESLKATNVDKIDWKPNLHRPGQPNANLFNGVFSPVQTGNSGMYGWGTH